MSATADLPPDSAPEFPSPSAGVRYSLPALLREVGLDRSSAAFAMEKLDQATITLLYERHRLRRESDRRQ